MKLLKKAAISFAAASMIVAPVAVSAAPAAEAARAVSTVEDQNELGGSSWILALLGVIAVVGGIILLSDGDDNPASAG